MQNATQSMHVYLLLPELYCRGRGTGAFNFDPFSEGGKIIDFEGIWLEADEKRKARLTGAADEKSKRKECLLMWERRAVQRCSPLLAQGRCHFKHKWQKKKKDPIMAELLRRAGQLLFTHWCLSGSAHLLLQWPPSIVGRGGGQAGCSFKSLVPCKQRSPGIIIAYFQHGILQIRSFWVLPKHTSETRYCSSGWLPCWRRWQSPQSSAFSLWLSHVQPMAQLRTSSSNTMRINFYTQTVWGVSVIRFVIQ